MKQFAVVTVYEGGDRFEPLVHVVNVVDNARKAKNLAKRLAREILLGDNEDRKPCDRRKFDQFWGLVDNGERNWVFKDWGYTALDNSMCLTSIRVVLWEGENASDL